MQEQTSRFPRARGVLPFWLGLCCVAGIATLYLLFPVANFTDAKDSLSYAARIEAGTPLFHPNHLLYEPLVYVVLGVVRVFSADVDPLAVMQGISLASALPFLFCIYLLAWRARQDAVLAVAATAAVAFSFGVWVYSVAPDGYLPPLFFAILSLVLLDPQTWRDRHDSPPAQLVLAAALCIAVAVLLHQMYVVFALIAGCILLFRADFGSFPARLRSFAILGGVSGGLVLAAYVATYLALSPAAPLLDWARGYARETLNYGGAPSLLTPVKGAIGAVSTMLTMNGLMAFDALADRLTAAFPTKSLLEERYLAQTAIPPLLRLPILLAMLGAVLAWLYIAGAAVADRWRATEPGGYVDRVLLASVIVYAVLVMIWEPTNREFWIQTYVFATLWCLRQITRFDRARGIGAGTLVACLFVVNFGAALHPLSDPRSDYWRHYNAEAIARRGEVDLIVTSCSWLCTWYLRYFAGAVVLSPAYTEPDILAERLTQADPARVLISSLAYAPHPLFGLENPQAVTPAWTQAFTARFPPPADLPATAKVQRFYRLENGMPRALP